VIAAAAGPAVRAAPIVSIAEAEALRGDVDGFLRRIRAA